MAEAALGLAASVISVASLAIQLADSVQKACEFWESVQDGPEEIGRISVELRLLSSILRFISHEQSTGMTDRVQEALVRDALNIAKRDINNLDIMVTQLLSEVGPGHGKIKRKWGQVKIALKSGKINKMKTLIERAKSTLTMLQTSRTQAAMYHISGRMDIISANMSSTSTATTERQLATLLNKERLSDSTYPTEQHPKESVQAESSSHSMATHAKIPGTSGLQVRTKTTWSSINAGLARLSIQSSSTMVYDPDDKEDRDSDAVSKPTRTTLVVNFLWGFSSGRRGFRLSFSNPFDSLKLDTIRRRPNDSLVFDLCWSGDTEGVHKLFLKGEASLFDIDEEGRGPLHYACRHGRSDLAKFLLSNGADYYQRSDPGNTAIDELFDYGRYGSDYPSAGVGNEDDLDYEVDEEYEEYDDEEEQEGEEDGDAYFHNVNQASRREIAKIVDTLVRDASLDPFDCPDRSRDFETLRLYRGLPHENLKYLLSQDSYLITAGGCFCLIYENLMALDDTVDDFQNCVDLLLTKYETMRQDPVTCKKWPYMGTTLQYLITQWIFGEKTKFSGSETRIIRCLTLTEDLYRSDGLGTPLDQIARLDPLNVDSWLKLLARNGIEISEYLQYEADRHPDGIVYQEYQCCRLIFLHFQQEESGITGVEVKNVCDPQYEHFHPEYRCEASRRRERCITKFSDIMIDEDGRPSQPVPGSWVGALKSNSELFLVFRNDWVGPQYVDFIGIGDLFWDETSGRWERRL